MKEEADEEDRPLCARVCVRVRQYIYPCIIFLHMQLNVSGQEGLRTNSDEPTLRVIH